MKSYLLFSVLLALTGWTYAQGSGSIDNIDVSQRTGEEERVVDIQFDLTGEGDYYDVYLEVSFDNGENFTQVNPGEVTDANNLAPANNIEITWDGRISYPEMDAEEAVIRLTATQQVQDDNENYYRTVKIGDQLWMAENLRVTEYRSGDAITTDDDWGDTTDGAYAIYDHNDLNEPNGAGNALKSCRQIGSDLGGDCVTSEHPRWISHDTHYGFDEFGFSALPGGSRSSNGSFNFLGFSGSWWSANESTGTYAFSRYMIIDYGRVPWAYSPKTAGLSVRCLRDLERTKDE